MEIEWLKFRVTPELREQFVQQDERIWTATLAQYPGFLSKETWIHPEQLSEITLVIRWESLEAWKSVPADVLQQADQRFAEAMGIDNYELIEAGRYQVRKVNRSSER
jgi:uncharacterized protein (TIGR03792 family)